MRVQQKSCEAVTLPKLPGGAAKVWTAYGPSRPKALNAALAKQYPDTYTRIRALIPTSPCENETDEVLKILRRQSLHDFVNCEFVVPATVV